MRFDHQHPCPLEQAAGLVQAAPCRVAFQGGEVLGKLFGGKALGTKAVDFAFVIPPRPRPIYRTVCRHTLLDIGGRLGFRCEVAKLAELACCTWHRVPLVRFLWPVGYAAAAAMR